MKHAGFGRAVGFPAAVIIEVLVLDIGHHGDIDIDPAEPSLRQSMAGHLQDAVRQARLDHFRQAGLNARGARRGHMQAGRHSLSAEVG